MTSRVPVYDTGMLIAPADREAKAVRLHAGLQDTPHRALVLGPVRARARRLSLATPRALVAPMAARHGSAVVFTSDPAGLNAHLKALDAQDVHVVQIRGAGRRS
ncbi:hypothetical protein AB0C40_24480 [Streptomyces brevispora]|uniref:hypothetical protein n=1 Tax=Streptomyces brevispora TaxID=887462 RepID=UPI0033F0CC5C